MPDFTWMEAQEELTSAALTVRAQQVDPYDEGRLLWGTFMPRVDVDTTKVSSLTTLNFRPSADRREWNQRGRYINLITPPSREIEWTPIESYFRLEEKEINDLMLEVRGNAALFQQLISVRIPARTDILALAAYRRLELEVFRAWTTGTFSWRNPQDGRQYDVSYLFDQDRYTTPVATWSNDPYDKFVAWLESAYEHIGPLAGAMMRLTTRNAIVRNAPNPTPGILAGIQPSVRDTELRIQDETGRPFRFFINENTVEEYDDGGITRTSRKIWPANTIAAVPADFRLGRTAFAPVVRAFDISNQTPDAGIDVRGVTVFHEIGNAGRDMAVEAQINPFPDPDESRLFVIDGLGI